MKLKYIFIFIFFGLLSQELMAQTSYKFSRRTDKFPYELKEFMTMRVDKSKKKATLEYLDRFEVFWLSDTLKDSDKLAIIRIANGMTLKRMRAFPELNKYLESLWTTARSKEGLKMYSTWLEILEPLLGARSKTNFLRFLDVSTDLFGGNILFKTASFHWKTDNLNFKLLTKGKLPIFVFDSLDLVCYTKVDSGAIYGTKGVCNPLKSTWEGEGGRVLWTRAEISEADVYAELTNYNVKLKSNRYICDTVTFYDQRRFDFPLMGRLSEKILTSKSTRITYPNFSSFRTDLTIKEVFRNVDYQGGYSLKGNVVVGIGSKDHKAYFIFKRKGQRFVWAGAEGFNINKNRIQSQNVNVIIYLEGE